MQRILIFLACLLIYEACYTQQYPFVYYTPKDGLINSRVRNIKQDGKGRMIFITYGGLSIYDGTRFANYTRQDGLADDLINDVVEAGPDSLLVATNSSKLNTLVKGKVGVYETADNFTPVVNRFLKCVDGRWLVTADGGLFSFANRRFTRLPMQENGSDIGIYLDQVIQWKNYLLLIPWSNPLAGKIILYDLTTKTVSDVAKNTPVISMAKDTLGSIWVTTENGPVLIDTGFLQKGTLKFIPAPKKFSDIAGSKFEFIFFDKEDNAWLFNKDIVKISPRFQPRKFTSEEGLESASMTNIFIDGEGTLWIATDGNGVIKMRNTNAELFNKLDSAIASVSAITNVNDTVWFYNSANQSIYRHIDNRFFPIKLKANNFYTNNLFVWGNKIYLNTGSEVMVINNKNDPASYQHMTVVPGVHSTYGIGAGILDKNGCLTQFVRESASTFALYVIHDSKLIAKKPIRFFVDQMTVDREGRLWMATRDNHVLVYSTHPGELDEYLHLEKDCTGFPELNPRAIAIDTGGFVWIGTRYNGVYRIDLQHGKFTTVAQFTARDGLTDNFVYTMTCDDNNTIWVGTQTGLDRIYLRGHRYIIGNVSKNNNFFQAVGKIVVTKNNTAWAITNGGLILRITGSLLNSTSVSVPTLSFSAIHVNNQILATTTNTFSSNENNLTFSVAATSYIDEKAIKYSYRLIGSDHTDWSEPLNNPNFNFNNIAPGEYTLEIKADFPEAIYAPETVTFSFTITPPWWQTWWFRALAILSVVGVLIFVTRLYYQQKLRKQKALLERKQAIEKERTRIATDMHDDLGAGLSRIKFLSETIGIKKQQQIPFEEDITKIREYSHEMIDKMGEIVWALNEKNDSINDLLSYTRSYAVEYLSQNGLDTSIQSPDAIAAFFITGDIRRNIFLSVKEVLHNIVKHAQATHTTICIKMDDHLTIEISDNGIGFDPAVVRPFSNGLGNIRKRMTDIHGEVQITGNSGTKVKLSVPLLI